MSKLTILEYPDTKLRIKAEPVDLSNGVPEYIKTLANNMAETMYSSHGQGLAAPQVGESVQVIVLDVDQDQEKSELRIYINPEISLMAGKVSSQEGCLSVPFIFDFVERAESIHFKAYNLDGNVVEFDASGDLAICLQHECDHLTGALFIDKMSPLKKKLALKNMVKKPIKAMAKIMNKANDRQKFNIM